MESNSELIAPTVDRQTSAHPAPQSGLSAPARPRRKIVNRTVRIFDPDQLRDAFDGAQVEHRLLEPGMFTARLIRIVADQHSLQTIQYSLPVSIEGAWAPGHAALVFGLNVTQPCIVHGRVFKTGSLALFEDGTGINARFGGGTHLAILTLYQKQGVEGRRDGLSFGAAPAGVPLEIGEPETRRLRSLLRTVIDDASLTMQLQSIPEASEVFEQHVLAAYTAALATARRPERNGMSSLQRRNRLVRKAEAYVTAHLDESVRMQKLCREVGASARSLEYAFQAIYGTGAMRYLRTVRMNEVRKALLRADSSSRATVTAAAMDWGFWHLGEFAAAYRRLFGELPSETLRIAAANNTARGVHPQLQFAQPAGKAH